MSYKPESEIEEKYLLILNETFFPFFSKDDLEKIELCTNKKSKDNPCFIYIDKTVFIKLPFVSVFQNKQSENKILKLMINDLKYVELGLIKNIVDKMQAYLKAIFSNNVDILLNLAKDIINHAIDDGICQWLSGGQPIESNYKKVLTALKKDSTITYEGKSITKIIGYKNQKFNDGQTNLKETVLNFINNKYSLPIANCNDTAILADRKSDKILEYIYANERDLSEEFIVPLQYSKICQTLQNENTLNIFILTNSGDILVVKDKLLVLKYSSNTWHYIKYNGFKTVLYKNLGICDENERIIFNSLIDVSFARTGGCLCILNDNIKDSELCEFINPVDLFENIYNNLNNNPEIKEVTKIKRQSIISAILPLDKAILPQNNNVDRNVNFFELNRKLRQELLSLDGATIIRKDGTLVATGAIISLKTQGDGGGRTAATKQLSDYGIAFKISEDGEITCYHDGDVVEM